MGIRFKRINKNYNFIMGSRGSGRTTAKEKQLIAALEKRLTAVSCSNIKG